MSAAVSLDAATPLRQAGEHFMRGERARAVVVLNAAMDGLRDPNLVARAAELFGQMGAHTEALACHRRLAAWMPCNPDVLLGWASAEMTAGSLERAERLAGEVLRRDPSNADAAYLRSQLRRQTREANHVASLRERLTSATDRRQQVALGHALAKELEDLGEHAASFEALDRAAGLRRASLSYDVGTDIDAMACIAQTFDADRLRRGSREASPARPIFVTGLPRTGTTLVERILGTVAGVAPLGELTEFPMTVTRMAGGTNKAETIARSAGIDTVALGRAYLAALAGYAEAPATIDKLPNNFLYIGLIRLALPRARVVHLCRHPMDAAYAIYKTLFWEGYPYSYSLTDLGRYYGAYHRLMRHWRDSIPGWVVDVSYEELTLDPVESTRALFDALDVPWSPDCLNFHTQKAAVATASAAQVRSRIHAGSVGLWRYHATGLRPFADALRRQGIDPFDQ